MKKLHEETLFEPYWVRCYSDFFLKFSLIRHEQNELAIPSDEKKPVSRRRKAEVISKIKSINLEGMGE